MRKAGRRGFTILEAVAALAILGIAGVAALEAVGGELRAAERARSVGVAAALAQDRVAAITLLEMDDLQPLGDSLAEGTFPPPFGDFRWTAVVRPVFGRSDLYDVRVEVANAATRYAVATRLYRASSRETVP